MKYNFTKSDNPKSIFGHSQAHNQSNDNPMSDFVLKIVSIISLFFKQKSNKTDSIFYSINIEQRENLWFTSENNLQEQSTNESIPQKSKNTNDLNTPDLATSQDSNTNKPSSKSRSTVKEYHLGSHFDEKSKRWTPSLSSPVLKVYKDDDEGDTPTNTIFKGFATTILLMLFSVLGVIAQTSSIDLSLRKEIDNSLPSLNGTVKYTLWLKNSGPSTATDIFVQDTFPIGGATLNSHTGGTNFTYNASSGLGLWNVASLAMGDSVKLEIIATVIQRGVFFNTAEVFSIGAGQEDIDSTPNNAKLNEDDIATSCFSVPIEWYPGEEYTVSIPALYKYGTNIKWFNGNTEITPSSTIAVVNADSSLTIKAPGVFSFTTNITSCPAQGCCAVQVIQGPYGSIGDFVWNDSNNNGLQDLGETGIAGIIIELYTSDVIGLPIGVPLKKDTTDAQGKYFFTGLAAGNYVVKVVTSTLSIGSQLTNKQNVGSDISIDSDFNSSTGLSDKISLDPNIPAKKDILTIDGGIYSPLGSIGNLVWKDLNNNGIQDSGEPGVEGVKMELYASDISGNAVGSALNTTATNASGYYTFNNLPKGDYVVRLVLNSIPATYLISTKVDAGADDTKDNDFNAITGYSPKVSIDPLVPAKKDNSTIDGAIYLPAVCSELVAITTDGDICVGDTTYIKVRLLLAEL